MAEPTEQIQTSIPSWLKEAMLKLVGQADVLTQQGYQPYARPKLDAQGKPVMDAQGKPVMEPIQCLEDFSPLQKQAFQNIAGMQTADQLRQATGLAGLAGVDASRLSQYNPATAQNFYDSPEFQRMQTGFERVGAAPATSFQMEGPGDVRAQELERLRMGGPERVGIGGLQQYQMGPAERVGAERFGLGAMQEYMSPYMQGVVESQKRGAVQDYMRQIPGMGAAAARAGAKGGTREALMQSEARRGLAERLGDIESQGLQQAYQQAAGQFGQDRAAMMQAALANQQAGLSTGQQNLAARLGVQQLGTQAGLQAALANQQAGLTTEQQNLAAALQTQGLSAQQAMQAALANQQARQQTGQTNLQALINQSQFGAGQGLQAQQLNQQAQLQAQQQALAQLAAANQFSQQNAQQRAQYGLSGANLAEQSRQFGAGLGMQGLQQQLAAAGMLGNLGQQQYQQQMGINAAQLGAGGQQQAFGQELLNQQYQDFLNQQRLPYQQLEFMSGILRGLPATGQTQTMYQAPGSLFGQIAGIGMGLGSLFGGFGQTTGTGK
jgi:hypothetical protein